jgi:outer membrane receptor protein involved in Fe transport
MLIYNVVFAVQAETTHLCGIVRDSISGKPVEFCAVAVVEESQWAMTDESGDFSLENLPSAKVMVTFSNLGYVKKQQMVDLSRGNAKIEVLLVPDNLTLDEVTVTAVRDKQEVATAYKLDQKALDHAQILNVSDAMSLLPGEKTRADRTLLSDSRMAIRAASSGEKGNPSFATAVEVDGVRLSNNASVDETAGTSTRAVSTANITGVEVVTGLPSVEYGDLANGLVKVKTARGLTPWIVTLSTKPNTKTAALSKGFRLGHSTLNLGGEFARSVSDPASPYTSYKRWGLNATYSTTIAMGVRSLMLTAGAAATVGGRNSKSDPDTYGDAFESRRDNNYRANIQAKFLLNSPVITNLTVAASVNYSDRLKRENVYKNNASTLPLIHATVGGYHIAERYDENPDAAIVLGPTGYWYQLSMLDDKPLTVNARIKANKTLRSKHTVNNLMLGAEYVSTMNRGRGLYYDDMRYAPTWRPYRYDELPAMNTISVYGEDDITVEKLGPGSLNARAGVRLDMNAINGSEYGLMSAISPRLSTRYQLIDSRDASLAFLASAGAAAKMPSFEVLYPRETYSDNTAFAPGAMADGTIFYAAHTLVQKPIFNPNLKIQQGRSIELGVEGSKSIFSASVNWFLNRTVNPYITTTGYTPYTYKLTTQQALEGCPIAQENRLYTIDSESGIVTVTDKSGRYPSQTLAYTEQNTFKSSTMYTNGSPITRHGLEWVFNVARIDAIASSFRLDGNFYNYRGVEQTMTAYCPVSYQGSDGKPYKYVGWYSGSSSSSNGTLTREVNTNFTVTTNIPKIRMIVSLKLESTLYTYKRSLSEQAEGDRSLILENASDYTGTAGNLNGKHYVATYPMYYSTWDKPDEKINFYETLVWARDNDRTLYNDLCKLVSKTNTDYYFRGSRISSYFSANLSVTKELGDRATLTFYATNFFNHVGLVKNSANDTYSSLYNSSYIPSFYYGMTLKIKI